MSIMCKNRKNKNVPEKSETNGVSVFKELSDKKLSYVSGGNGTSQSVTKFCPDCDRRMPVDANGCCTGCGAKL